MKNLMRTLGLLFYFGIAQAAIPNNAKISISAMLTHATPTVVNITVEKTINPQDLPSLPGRTPQNQQTPLKGIAVGSGVIINAAQGLIVTNAHVVKNQKIMIVTLKDGRRFHATLIGEDDKFDIAVIRIKAEHLSAVTFANSDKVNVGDFVVAIGSPFGLTQTVTSGVISALNRTNPRVEGYQDFIQTDAPINPGNSGGALLDMDGKLVGINTAIIAPIEANSGIGFAIPSNMTKSVVEQLIQYGKVTPGMLGVVAENLTPELVDALSLKSDVGVLVTQVIEGTPAQAAGILSQDIILKVNDSTIHSSDQLHNMLGILRPGTALSISLLRNQVEKQMHLTVGDPKAILKQQQLPFLSGIRLQNFSDLELNGKLLSGAGVSDIADNSGGALAGLLPGDVIVAANGKTIATIQDLIKIAESNPAHLLLKVVRANSTLFLVIQRNA